MNFIPPPPSQNSHAKMALYRWIRTESRWNKKLISLSSPDWSASLRPSLERKTRPDALIRPNDSTATGWKMWWAWMFEYFAVWRVAASSAAEPASRAAAATYESANGQMTVTSQDSGFPASQGTRERPSGRFPSDRLRPSGSLVHGILLLLLLNMHWFQWRLTLNRGNLHSQFSSLKPIISNLRHCIKSVKWIEKMFSVVGGMSAATVMPWWLAEGLSMLWLQGTVYLVGPRILPWKGAFCSDISRHIM